MNSGLVDVSLMKREYIITVVLKLFGWIKIVVAELAWQPMPLNSYLDKLSHCNI